MLIPISWKRPASVPKETTSLELSPVILDTNSHASESFILLNPISAVGSDFYDGLAGGELIGDLNAPDSFGEVSNSDLAGWSTQEYGDVASNGSGTFKPVDPRMRGLRVTLDELDHSHGIDHTYKHLQVCNSKTMSGYGGIERMIY